MAVEQREKVFVLCQDDAHVLRTCSVKDREVARTQEIDVNDVLCVEIRRFGKRACQRGR